MRSHIDNSKNVLVAFSTLILQYNFTLKSTDILGCIHNFIFRRELQSPESEQIFSSEKASYFTACAISKMFITSIGENLLM